MWSLRISLRLLALRLRVGRRILKELGHVTTEAAVQLRGKELGRFRHCEDPVRALQVRVRVRDRVGG